ncbi:MAG: homoserine dehydrogenase, partial [Acidimicrobiia bacterium]
VFNLVRETLPCARIVGFRGILNSTTNYILSRMEQGEDPESALATMREAGIAEADASLDLDGSDAAAKTAALANVLLEARTTPREIKRRGITDLSVGDMNVALKQERRIRLVARATRSGDGLDAEVGPVSVPVTDLLATLKGTSNALILTTDLAGELAVVEYNPTLTHTAYAVLSDLISVVRRPAVPP